MNLKKLGVFSILLFLLVMPLMMSFVSAGWSDLVGDNTFAKILRYIFGETTALTGVNDTSTAIITIAVWLLVIITFGDIIATFSTFSAWVSWVAAFLIGVITANMGLITAIIAWMTAIFASLGVAAVYVGLGAAFVAFMLVNLGVWNARKWILRRRAMQAAAKMEAGGKKLSGTIKGLGDVGKAMSKI